MMQVRNENVYYAIVIIQVRTVVIFKYQFGIIQIHIWNTFKTRVTVLFKNTPRVFGNEFLIQFNFLTRSSVKEVLRYNPQL